MRFGLFLLFEWPGPPRTFPAMFDEILEQIEYAEEQGLMNMNFGNMTHREAMRSLRLFGQEVLPAFR